MLNVVLISSFGGPTDEGQKNVASAIARELSQTFIVYSIGPRAAIAACLRFDSIIRAADVIHIILRVNQRVALLSMLLRLVARKARIVISILQPIADLLGRRSIPWGLQADYLICLTDEDRLALQIDWNVYMLPNGVDLHKFKPVDPDTRHNLHVKYGLDSGCPVILHVGQITLGRRLEEIVALKDAVSGQAIVIGGSSVAQDQEACTHLERAGVKVLRSFIPNIEEYYQLADLYLFPATSAENAVYMPLSVLEAMACNLPVLSTRFPGLDTGWLKGPGLVFFDRREDMINKARVLLEKKNDIEPRMLVMDLDWSKVAAGVADIYRCG